MEVFEQSLKDGVAVHPGTPFCSDGGGGNTIPLNFSNSAETKIMSGMEWLSRVLRRLM